MNVSKDVWVRSVRRCGFAFGFVVLVVSAGVATAAEDAVVNATGGNDRILLQLEKGDPSKLEVRVGEVVVLSEAVANLSSVTINGLLGDDTLNVDYSNGFFAVPTTFNGGFQTTPTGDSLEVSGSIPGAGASSYTPGPPSVEGKSGTITSSTGASTHFIRFSGLEPVTFSGGFGLSIFASSSTTTSLSDDPIDMAGPGGNVLTGDGGLETIYFAGYSSFTVYGGAGSQTMTVTDLDPAPWINGVALTTVTIDGQLDGVNTNVSPNTINLHTLPASITANLKGDAGNDIVNLGSPLNTLDGILGPVNVDGRDYAVGVTISTVTVANGLTVTVALPYGDNLWYHDEGNTSPAQYNLTSTTLNRDTTVAPVTYSNIETLRLNAGQHLNDIYVTSTAAIANFIAGNNQADDFYITATAAGSIVGVTPLDGNDRVEVGSVGDGGSLTVSGGAGMDRITVDSIGVGSSLKARPGDSADTIIVGATGAGSATYVDGQAWDDEIYLRASAATSEIELHGGDDDDVFAVGGPGLDNLLGGFSVDGGTGTDSLTFDDSTDTSNNSYDVLDASLVRTGSPSLVFGAVETLSLLCGTGQDDVLVDLDNPPSAVQTFFLDAGDETGTDGDAVIAYGTTAIDMTLLGGDPSSSPGDSLVYTAPVNFFDEFETLETSALVVSPTAVQFTGLVPGSPMECRTIEVTNEGSIPFDWSATGCDASPFSLSPAIPGGTIDPGVTETFDVCLDASTITEPTILSCTIDFTSDDPNLTDLEIPVFANLGLAIPGLGPLGMLLFVFLISAGALYALRR